MQSANTCVLNIGGGEIWTLNYFGVLAERGWRETCGNNYEEIYFLS